MNLPQEGIGPKEGLEGGGEVYTNISKAINL